VHLLFDAAHDDPGALQLRLISDQVMGGVSQGQLRREDVDGRPALRLTGEVRLENNGGFLQMAGDLPTEAREATGLQLEVFGNGETYGCHLRTSDLPRPWQSFRHSFEATAQWTSIQLHFKDFTPHRTDAPFRIDRLRRLGLIAIGRAFFADLAVARIHLCP
jgi:hypothetical protein